MDRALREYASFHWRDLGCWPQHPKAGALEWLPAVHRWSQLFRDPGVKDFPGPTELKDLLLLTLARETLYPQSPEYGWVTNYLRQIQHPRAAAALER